MRNIIGTLFLAIFVFYCSSNVVWGGDFNKGEAAFYKKDYAAALREFTPLAESGNEFAQTSLAVMYQHGLGVPKDHDKAANLYFLAFSNGNLMALTFLGQLMLDPESKLFDAKKGKSLILLAADNGDEAAQKLIEVNASFFSSSSGGSVSSDKKQ